jgi:centromeric protein E
MEKEIKELKLQRDVAESRLQDLLKVVGDNHGSKHPLVDTLHYFLVDQLDCSFITKNNNLPSM